MAGYDGMSGGLMLGYVRPDDMWEGVAVVQVVT